MNLPNGWKPRSYQLKAWQYLEWSGKHAELIWHRRSGKDDICLHRAACAAHERVANYWHMLPEYAQARKAIWAAINPHTGKRRIDEAFPLELRASTREQEMQIVFTNGSSWQVVGSDRYDSLVGSSPAGIIWSEWALANPAARAYLRPMIEENGGWQVFITTPRGRNHAYTTFKSAQNKSGAFTQILDATQTGIWTPDDLSRILADYIADFGEEYGRSKYEQEYLCSFESANMGAILARSIGIAEQEGRIGDHVQFDPYGAPLEISADIGRRDSATWWFWQPRVGGYAVVECDSGWGIGADEWVERLADKISQYRLEGNRSALGKIWLPHDARAKTFAAQHSAVEIFIKKFGSDRVAITPSSKRADRVNAARVAIGRVEFNATKCEKGLEGLIAWSYEYDEEKKVFSPEPKHDWASDFGDGFSYGCQIMRLHNPVKKNENVIKGLTVFDNSVTLDEMWKSSSTSRRLRI